MESRRLDTKRKVELGRDEAGRDAKRLCQPSKTLLQPSTDSSKFYDLAVCGTQDKGWNETGRAALEDGSPVTLPAINELAFSGSKILKFLSIETHFPVLEPFQYTKSDTTQALVSPDCSLPSASAYYGDQVGQLPFNHSSRSQFEFFTPTSYPEWDALDYSGHDLIPSPDGIYTITEQGDIVQQPAASFAPLEPSSQWDAGSCSFPSTRGESDAILSGDVRHSTSRQIVGQKENLPGNCANINNEWNRSSIGGHPGQLCDSAVIANDEVEPEPINTEVAAYSNSAGAVSVGSDHDLGYDACFGVVSKRVPNSISTKR